MEVKNLNELQKATLQIKGLPSLAKKEAKYIKFQQGDYLCKEEESMDYLLFMVSGRAKVSITAANGRTLLLNFYGEGGVLGDVEMMLSRGLGTTNVVAITQVECIGLPVSYCKSILSSDIEFMNFIAKNLAKKLNSSSRNSAMNLLYSLENRLCAYIEATEEQGKFSENLTEIAELLGTSYRHLLRTLKDLCELGIIERYSRTKYRIKDIEKLRENAAECFIIY